jgi:opacity protein-like surface antigen
MSKRPLSILLAVASNLAAASGIATVAVMMGTSAAALAQSAGTQSTDDILRRLQAVEAHNAALAKENAALHEQIKLSEENTKLRGRTSELRDSKHEPTVQQRAKTSASPSNRTDPKLALYDRASSPMVPLAPVYNWTGWYVGVNAGASFGTFKTDFNVAPFVLTNGLGSVDSYVTGGLAYGKVELDGTFGGVIDTVLPFTLGQSISHSQVNTGRVVGTGTEGKLLIPGWTLKAEYLYMDLGTFDNAGAGFSPATNCPGCSGPFTGTGGQVTMHTHFTDNIVRVGLNYQFH